MSAYDDIRGIISNIEDVMEEVDELMSSIVNLEDEVQDIVSHLEDVLYEDDIETIKDIVNNALNRLKEVQSKLY